jgi:hypothetical protein
MGSSDAVPSNAYERFAAEGITPLAALVALPVPTAGPSGLVAVATDRARNGATTGRWRLGS